jgi:1,4-alpha-glucan branching enzyme
VFQTILKQLKTEENGIDAFTSAYTHYGIHVDCRTNEIKIKEWAPNARAMYIRGDFSSYLNYKFFIIKFHFSIDHWQERQYPFTRDEWGVWRITIPALSDGSAAIKHGQAIKVKPSNLILILTICFSPSCSLKHQVEN